MCVCVCVCVCVVRHATHPCGGGVSRLQILFARHRHIAAPGLGLISSRRTRSFLTRAAREVKPILVSGAGWLVHWRSVGVRIDSDPTIGFGNRGIFVSSLTGRGCGVEIMSIDGKQPYGHGNCAHASQSIVYCDIGRPREQSSRVVGIERTTSSLRTKRSTN